MVNAVSTMTMAASLWLKKKADKLPRLLEIIWHVFCRTTGMAFHFDGHNLHCLLIHQSSRLLTVGTTVDEAAFLFYSLDKACHSQLMAEAAAANGIPKIVISDEVAAYTASSVQNPVRHFLAICQIKHWTVTDRLYSIICTPNSSQSLSSLSRSLMAACLSRNSEKRGAESRRYNEIYINAIMTI